jgi:hypothetical protein
MLGYRDLPGIDGAPSSVAKEIVHQRRVSSAERYAFRPIPVLPELYWIHVRLPEGVLFPLPPIELNPQNTQIYSESVRVPHPASRTVAQAASSKDGGKRAVAPRSAETA